VEISDFCCLAITVDECSDWLQRCLMNIHAKIISFHFRRGSMLNKIILGRSTDGGGSGLNFFKNNFILT